MQLLPRKKPSLEKICLIKTPAASRLGLSAIPSVLLEQWECEKEDYLQYRYAKEQPENMPRKISTDPMNYGIDFPQFKVWLSEYFNHESNLVYQILKQSHIDNELGFEAYVALGMQARQMVQDYKTIYHELEDKAREANFCWSSSTRYSPENVEFLSACCDYLQEKTTFMLKQWESLCQEYALDASSYYINLFDRVCVARLLTFSQETSNDTQDKQDKQDVASSK